MREGKYCLSISFGGNAASIPDLLLSRHLDFFFCWLDSQHHRVICAAAIYFSWLVGILPDRKRLDFLYEDHEEPGGGNEHIEFFFVSSLPCLWRNKIGQYFLIFDYLIWNFERWVNLISNLWTGEMVGQKN